MSVTSDIGTIVMNAIQSRTGKTVSCKSCRDSILALNGLGKDYAAINAQKLASRIVNRSLGRNQCWIASLRSLSSEPIIDVVAAYIMQSLPVCTEAFCQDDVESLGHKQQTPSRFVEGQHKNKYAGFFSGRCSAITSLSPNVSRKNRQDECVQSWIDVGLSVITVNTGDELDGMECDERVVKVASDDVTSYYDRPTQSISSLLSAGIQTGLPFILINADIEIDGHPSVIEEAISHKDAVTVGVRHNYPSGSQKNMARREPFGLDVFVLTPEIASKIPPSPLGIGKPVWDYFIPWYVRELGNQIRWIKSEYFFHESHTVHWSQDEWAFGAKWIYDKYAVNVGDSGFRAALEKSL